MADYFTAAYPEPYQILGVRLLPFSFGHYLKLHRLGCAFVRDDKADATLGDLLLGAAVCSMPSDPDPSKDKFWNWFNSEPLKWKRIVAGLFKKTPLTPFERDIVRWGKKTGNRFDATEKCKLFADYLQQHTKQPDYWEGDAEDRKESGAHWAHGVMATLMANCGYSAQEAYNTPVAKCLFDYFKYAESQGALTLMSQEEQDIVAGRKTA